MPRLLDDAPSTIIALALIVGDVVLHLAHSAANPFDEAIPIIAGILIAGRMVGQAASNGKSQKPAPAPAPEEVSDAAAKPAPPAP